MSDETRNYIQNLIDLQEHAEAAQEELRNYLQNTFGTLGDDMMSSLENAIKDRGVNAWDEFGKAGAKVIEQLGKQIAYELFLLIGLKIYKVNLKPFMVAIKTKRILHVKQWIWLEISIKTSVHKWNWRKASWRIGRKKLKIRHESLAI